MIRRRWMRWGAVGALAAVALSGCVGEEDPTPSTSASGNQDPQPSQDIASEARSTYDQYLIEVGAMYVEADDDYTRLLEWATSEMATLEAAGIADLTESGITVSEWYTVTSFEVQDVQNDSIAVAACVDVANVRLTGPGGEDVTPADRDPLVPLSLHFERRSDASLLLDAQDPWDPSVGQSPCPA